ncbi:MAG: insulinase family protein, partial [Alphaproteobacteria bacterium]|nr:insulinase family protein [Alphaproteobacteria bacterium]
MMVPLKKIFLIYTAFFSLCLTHICAEDTSATSPPPPSPSATTSKSPENSSLKHDSTIFNHQSFTLKNGLTIYFIKNTLAPVVNVSLYYKIGTADDPRDQHGLSHFVEHMMFKGTTRVPKGKFDNLLLKQGANYNAHTTPDYTCYEATIAKDQLELVLFLEADRMVNLTFTKEDIDSERQVVHEERAMRLDNNPFGKAIEIYLRSLYWKHPYGIPTIGYPEHIDAYTYDSVQHHYKTYYAPNNAILIVAGDTTLDVLKPLVEKYFSDIPSKTIPERVRMQEPDHGDTTIRIDHYADRNHVVVIEY